jgi:capsular exopolysaccharide synthesis family protein
MVAYSRAETQGAMENNNLSGSLVTALEPTSVAAEAYRYVRTNLLYRLPGTSSNVIMVTSPRSEEGKSTICANLGVVLAQAGKDTLVLDCNFREPVIHEIFGLRSTPGIADVLAGTHEVREACQEPLSDSRLRVLTVGTLPPDPTGLLGSPRFLEALSGIREEFDYVLIDSPPIGMVSDPAILATHSDGVLLTLDAHAGRKEDAYQAVHNLMSVGANVLGTVMNNVKDSRK